MLGWRATNGEQSRFLRQVPLYLKKKNDCGDCKDRLILETEVGENNEDACGGDSGRTIII